MISAIEDMLVRVLFGVLTLIGAPFLLVLLAVEFARERWGAQ